jgi:hypothetical protein
MQALVRVRYAIESGTSARSARAKHGLFYLGSLQNILQQRIWEAWRTGVDREGCSFRVVVGNKQRLICQGIAR